MRNCRCADENGLVCEMFKHASDDFLELLLTFLNDMLENKCVDPCWRTTLFSMLPKTGDLKQVQNLTPIAVLSISYKIFDRLLYHRLRAILDKEQSPDQVGFRKEMLAEDAFLVLESICGKSLEWKQPLWCVSLDLSKDFDRLE